MATETIPDAAPLRFAWTGQAGLASAVRFTDGGRMSVQPETKHWRWWACVGQWRDARVTLTATGLAGSALNAKRHAEAAWEILGEARRLLDAASGPPNPEQTHLWDHGNKQR